MQKAVVCSFKFIANNISALSYKSVEVKKYGEYEITVNINTGVVEDKFLKSLSIMCLNGIVCTKTN